MAGDALVRELKRVGQRHGHVERAHALVPVGEEPADFGNRFSGAVLVYGIAFAGQLLPVLRPAPQDAVQPQNRVKLRVILSSAHPNGALLGVERIIGHHHIAYAGYLQHFSDVRLDRLRREEPPRLLQP